ncbi:hypothetical protein [Blastococcus mobilis]|uniref:Uncharacterized protein n=1 Tax=Blastococcus mobilis TaxID=1938746 RepID=A0A238VHP1_9ACTN|nr:hypothetical protein [Blastococcus mobilis]SNR33193.1 hypothetical protein SAMN06272737_103102 [Blastococcus mobilis]
MTAGDIGTMLTGLTALVTALGAIYLQRQRRAALDADALEKERNGLRQRVESLLRYIHVLRRLLAEHGIEAPPMPAEPDETEVKR